MPMVAAEKHRWGLGPDGWGFGFWLCYSLPVTWSTPLDLRWALRTETVLPAPQGGCQDWRLWAKGLRIHVCAEGDVGTQLSRGLQTLQPGPPVPSPPRPVPPAPRVTFDPSDSSFIIFPLKYLHGVGEHGLQFLSGSFLPLRPCSDPTVPLAMQVTFPPWTLF